MLLRKWESGDNQPIAQLEQQCFSFPWNYDMLFETYSQENFCGLVCENQNSVVGYVGAIIGYDSADIALIAVSPLFRKQNIAFNLMREIIDKLKEKGVIQVFLEVRVSNQPAINLYEKCGFTSISIRKNYYEDTEDAIVMVKEI